MLVGAARCPTEFPRTPQLMRMERGRQKNSQNPYGALFFPSRLVISPLPCGHEIFYEHEICFLTMAKVYTLFVKII